MDVKLFEIRDRATFIAVLAVRLQYRDEAERFLLRRAGYAKHQIEPDSNETPYVLLARLDGDSCSYDPYDWGNRTMANAHNWIIDHWKELQSGAVIDVEFILGETTTAKISERITTYAEPL